MPLRKRHTRTRLQVALERDGTALVGEFDDDIDGPWTVPCGVMPSSGVVLLKPSGDVRCQARVVPRRTLPVLENVDIELGHAVEVSNAPASPEGASNRRSDMARHSDRKLGLSKCNGPKREAETGMSTFARWN